MRSKWGRMSNGEGGGGLSKVYGEVGDGGGGGGGRAEK